MIHLLQVVGLTIHLTHYVEHITQSLNCKEISCRVRLTKNKSQIASLHWLDTWPLGGGLEQETREWITSLWSGSFSQLYTSMTVYIKPPLRMPQSVTNSYRFETDVTWEIPDPGDLNRRWRTAPPSFDFYHSTRYNSYLPRLTFRIVPDHKMLCLWSNIFLHRS